MIRPAEGVITQRFSAAHQALDIAGEFGSPILAPHAGKITIAGNLGECGIAVEIDGGQFRSRFCHNSVVTVPFGQNVAAGSQVAKMGYTGKTIPAGPAGTHCHWVLWVDGTRVDPEKYISNDSAMARFTREQHQLLHIIATGGKTPGAGYNYPFGQTEITSRSLDLFLQHGKAIADSFGQAGGVVLKPGRYIVK